MTYLALPADRLPIASLIARDPSGGILARLAGRRVAYAFSTRVAIRAACDALGLKPGDEVLVHGAPILAAYGELIVEDRQATITRASWIERLWTRATGDFGFMELCEFSFSDEVTL